MEALCSSAVGTVKRIHENSVLFAMCPPGAQPSREKLLDLGEWGSLASRVPSLSFSKQRESAPFCGGSSPSFLLSCFCILRLAPLSFSLSQNASQEGPWSQLLEPCVKVHRWVPSPWESEFQPSFSMGKTDCIMGEGLRQHQAGRAPGSAETAGKAASFSGVALHTGVNVPTALWVCWWGALLCLCSASGCALWGRD